MSVELSAKVDEAIALIKEVLAEVRKAPRATSAPVYSGGGPVFPPYGRSKGAPIAGATQQDLEYYASGCKRSLADESKARFHDKERGLLAAIEAELTKHYGASADVSEPF